MNWCVEFCSWKAFIRWDECELQLDVQLRSYSSYKYWCKDNDLTMIWFDQISIGCGQLKQFSSKIYKNKINKKRTVYPTRDVKRVWNRRELAQQYTRWAKVARFPIQHSVSLLESDDGCTSPSPNIKLRANTSREDRLQPILQFWVDVYT